MTHLGRLMPERLGQVGLANAGRTNQQNVLSLPDELASGKSHYQYRQSCSMAGHAGCGLFLMAGVFLDD